jgi:hypothetical protein
MQKLTRERINEMWASRSPDDEPTDIWEAVGTIEGMGLSEALCHPIRDLLLVEGTEGGFNPCTVDSKLFYAVLDMLETIFGVGLALGYRAAEADLLDKAVK